MPVDSADGGHEPFVKNIVDIYKTKKQSKNHHKQSKKNKPKKDVRKIRKTSTEAQYSNIFGVVTPPVGERSENLLDLYQSPILEQ